MPFEKTITARVTQGGGVVKISEVGRIYDAFCHAQFFTLRPFERLRLLADVGASVPAYVPVS